MTGNETYKSLAPLGNPRLDAGRLDALLDANGFDVVRCAASTPAASVSTATGWRRPSKAFARRTDGAELALVFYAGHGMEGRDENKLTTDHQI